MHTVETTAEGHDRGLELLREILPWLEASTGFRGALRLATADRSKTVVLTFWADEAALDALTRGEPRGSARRSPTSAGTTRVALEEYEVTFRHDVGRIRRSRTGEIQVKGAPANAVVSPLRRRLTCAGHRARLPTDLAARCQGLMPREAKH